MAKYTHLVEKHNMESPRHLVPYILELGNFNSVIDVGCGLGTFLRAFKEEGVIEILGIDGKWCNKELLFENIDPQEFIEQDLESSIELARKFDLAISLEVAEHLSQERANSFVRDLTKLSDNIVFSAAIKFQGGDHHINEQPLSYWIELFNSYGFNCYDVIRPSIWENDKIFWWYRQNIVLFKKAVNGQQIENRLSEPVNIVHPELLRTYANPKDKNAVKRYMKLLLKSILAKLKK